MSTASSRTKLGIRIGALVAAVAGMAIYISTGRPTGTEGAPSSGPAANVEPPQSPLAENPTSQVATPEPAAPVQAAEAPSGATPAPASASASARPAATPSHPAGLFDDRR